MTTATETKINWDQMDAICKLTDTYSRLILQVSTDDDLVVSLKALILRTLDGGS